MTYMSCDQLMSCSEEETNAASVLSQMSQIQQIPSDTIESQGMSVAHQCDVETTTSANCSQEFVSMAIGHIIESCQGQEHLATSSDLDGRMDKNTNITTTTLEVSSGSVKVFQCEYCAKVFNKSSNLKTHHRVHTGERPFPCSLCGHGFANLGDLKRHTRTHTGEKPFTCEFCNKAFSDFGSHKRHLRLHTGFKPFKCEQCDREFTRLDSFKNHTRLHTGERPYKCEECQKEFNYLTTYKRHLNIHSGERPYSCNLCEKTFTRLSYLKNHKLNHGKLPSNAAQDDRPADEAESALSTAVIDSSRIPHISKSDVTNDNDQGKPADDHVIYQVAQALCQGVQVSVTTIMDTNGTTQPILIETPDVGSNETSHTLILTQDILSPQSSANDNEQLLEFTAGPSNKKSSTFVKNDVQDRTETTQLFVTQSGQDFNAESQTLLNASFDDVITVTEQQEGNIVKVNEHEKQIKDEHEAEKNISEITTEHPEVGRATNNHNAVYITIDPEETNVQQIIGELHVAINPESLIERN